MECPSGSACPDYSTSSYIPCPLGRYNSFAGQTNCSACPQGKYGPYKGAAICLDCPKGKFGPRNGSTALDECEDCPAGKFSSVDGLYSCTFCSKSEYQPEKGQSSCLECPGVGEIGDAKRTGCMTDPSIAKLRDSTFIEELFSEGIALYVSFSIAALFIATFFLVNFKKVWFNDAQQSLALPQSKESGNIESRVGIMTPLQIVMKSGLAGFSFGSELFLIIGLSEDAPHLSIVMLLFRLTHILVAGMYVSMSLEMRE